MIISIIREINWLPKHIIHGEANGYCIVDKNHPIFGKSFWELEFIKVHGGITFSELLTEDLCNQFEISLDNIGKWCVGFDTCHLGDNSEKL